MKHIIIAITGCLLILLARTATVDAAEYTITYTLNGVSKTYHKDFRHVKGCMRIFAAQLAHDPTSMLKFDKVSCKGPGRDSLTMTRKDIRDILYGN